MSPMFSEMAGQNVTNGTFPKTLGPKASTYVGSNCDPSPHVAVVWQKKRGFLVSLAICAHTLRLFPDKCTSFKYFQTRFLKCILKTERFKTYGQRSIRSMPYKLSGKTKFSMASCTT